MLNLCTEIIRLTVIALHLIYVRVLTGYILVSEWCRCMEAATGLGLPWRMLRDKLVAVDADTQLVKYSTTFDKLSDNTNSVRTRRSSTYTFTEHF